VVYYNVSRRLLFGFIIKENNLWKISNKNQYLFLNFFQAINALLPPPPKAAGVYNSLLYTKKYL